MIENQFAQDRHELGQNQDLERAIDRDDEFEDKDLRTKVIFAVQNIGKVENFKKDGKQIEAYIKKEHCEQSIKDLVKYLRMDVAENPKVSLILSEFNIMESDLIKILVLHAEDKKLSFWLLALMSYLTTKPSDGLEQNEKQRLNSALKQYKKTFTKNEGITYLILHISDYVKTPVEKRQKAHVQIMEFIIILVRNLLQIKNEEAGSNDLHSHFLLAMVKEDMLGPLFYILQHEKGVRHAKTEQFSKSQLMQRIETPLLEIFYHVFTCFDPATLYETKAKINIWHEAQKQSSKKPQQARHSRFMPNFAQVSKSGISKIVHTLDKKEEINPNQRKTPNRVAQLKKVKKIERDYIEQNFLEMMVDAQDDGNRKPIRELIFEYAKQFVEVEFQILSKLVFDNIYRETAKVSKENIMQYLMLCSWVLRMTRSKYKKELMVKSQKERSSVEFDFGQVLCIMQTAHFELIYKLLFREATREKKKQFDINMFNAALLLFLNYLEVIEDISMSFNMSDRKNANALMANMFRHDIARIFKIGFHQIIHQKILRTLILTTYKFFKLLSEYSGGKVLTIQTSKLLKGKKKGKKGESDEEREMKNFISDDSDEGNQSDSYNEKQQKQKKVKKQTKPRKPQQQIEELKFQERKFNEVTEFAIIADNETISKHLVFLKNQRFLQNSKQLNVAIFYYFERILTLLKGEWLFFQAETLLIFNDIINNHQFSREYNKQKDVIKKICFSFITLLKNNNLALVQSLFRYSSVQLKDQILSNYNDFREEQHYQQDDSDL